MRTSPPATWWTPTRAETVDTPEQNDVSSTEFAEAADGEARRAIEAILMVAVDLHQADSFGEIQVSWRPDANFAAGDLVDHYEG